MRVYCAAFVAGLLFAHDLLAAEIRAVSPDGNVQLTVGDHETGLIYTVSSRGENVIERSRLSLSLDGVEITQGAVIGQLSSYQIDESYPWRGVHSTAVNHCNGLAAVVSHTAIDLPYTLELRAFNDGVAFRYVIFDGQKPHVPDEATTFVLPAGSTLWHHGLDGHYEGAHKKSDGAEVSSGEWIAPPLTFKLPANAGYASITEAALVNYSGMALRADGNRQFRLVLGHKHPISYPYRLRYSSEDIERASQPATITGKIITPWRVVLIGRDLNALVNADVIHNLCPPADAKLFPDGVKTPWVRPGRSVWKYLDGGDSSIEGQKQFCRMAGELGFEYNVIEGFWRRWSDEQLRELVAYGKQYGVGLWLWKHSKELREPEARQAFFQRCQDLGIVGVKIDFFDHEAREVVDFYQDLLRGAAEHRLLVNFHGGNKPTGEPRTWPNELVRESVRGMESSRLKERALHDATLPFTRLLAGHADYTPVHFGQRRADTTWAHQVATAVVFTAPLLTYGAHPQTMLDNPCAEMLKSIPATWDETIVLPLSEIGEVAAFARRKGDDWFLALVNGPTAREAQIPLTFLAPGEYQAHLVRDHQDDPAAVNVGRETLNRDSRLTVGLSSGGGFVARFSKN